MSQMWLLLKRTLTTDLAPWEQEECINTYNGNDLWYYRMHSERRDKRIKRCVFGLGLILTDVVSLTGGHCAGGRTSWRKGQQRRNSQWTTNAWHHLLWLNIDFSCDSVIFLKKNLFWILLLLLLGWQRTQRYTRRKGGKRSRRSTRRSGKMN